MNWHKYALMANDPNKNIEDMIFREVVERSDQEIIDLVNDNYDIITEEATRKLEIGMDLEVVVDDITRSFGRSTGFSPDRSLEWSTLWTCIFEKVQPLSSSEDEWETRSQ